jgi:hypothetical protein
MDLEITAVLVVPHIGSRRVAVVDGDQGNTSQTVHGGWERAVTGRDAGVWSVERHERALSYAGSGEQKCGGEDENGAKRISERAGAIH